MALPAEKKTFKCPDCTAEFSRKDHAKRHKLSHQHPEFECPHPDCGLFFHRRDVLKRHEGVHRPENAEKRRRPRRGPLPTALPKFEGPQRPLPASESPEPQLVLMTASGSTRSGSYSSAPDFQSGDGGDWASSTEDGDVDPACLCSVENGTVCHHCSSELIRLSDGRIPSVSHDIIHFCITHYIQSQLKWFPFICSYSLRKNWLISGRALILAALGAQAIKEYKELAEGLWEEALPRIDDWHLSSAPGSSMLSNFQTKILMMEYLHWRDDNAHPGRVVSLLYEMANREVQELMSMLAPPGKGAYMSMEDELLQEEIRWTLWKFYCTLTQTSLLGMKLHPPPLFQDLNLPGDAEQLSALSRSVGVGRENETAVVSRRKQCGRSRTIPQALSDLLADERTRENLPDSLSMVGQYILLHAMLYLSDNMVEEIDLGVSRPEPLGWRVETRGRLYRLVVRWRQCFWIPPEILWKTSFPEFGSLQSTMFIIYLAVRVSQPSRASDHKMTASWFRHPYSPFAMRCIVAVHMSMKNNNLLEVAAKGRWFLDGACWRTGSLTAKYAVEWFQDRADSGCEDEDIEVLQNLESIMSFYDPTQHYNGIPSSQGRIAQVKRSIRHLWTTILGTDGWLGSQLEEPYSFG
ncbi:hypothetical protein F4777DRAFT_512376 [Nemania sp. FL0916]|nr:hypothetical protein F4777DRAFT_512376 [Nemania sp. FL0916]